MHPCSLVVFFLCAFVGTFPCSYFRYRSTVRTSMEQQLLKKLFIFFTVLTQGLLIMIYYFNLLLPELSSFVKWTLSFIILLTTFPRSKMNFYTLLCSLKIIQDLFFFLFTSQYRYQFSSDGKDSGITFQLFIKNDDRGPLRKITLSNKSYRNRD